MNATPLQLRGVSPRTWVVKDDSDLGPGVRWDRDSVGRIGVGQPGMDCSCELVENWQSHGTSQEASTPKRAHPQYISVSALRWDAFSGRIPFRVCPMLCPHSVLTSVETGALSQPLSPHLSFSSSLALYPQAHMTAGRPE